MSRDGLVGPVVDEPVALGELDAQGVGEVVREVEAGGVRQAVLKEEQGNENEK